MLEFLQPDGSTRPSITEDLNEEKNEEEKADYLEHELAYRKQMMEFYLNKNQPERRKQHEQY